MASWLRCEPILLDPNFHRPKKIFDQNYFGPIGSNIFMTLIFFIQIFLDQNVFRPKIILDQKLLWTENIFDRQFFSTKIFF